MYGLLAGLFTWGMTALGASLVFFAARFKNLRLDSILGFSAGIMIAASFTSLLMPAFDYASTIDYGIKSEFVVLLGFMCGALFLLALDHVIPHLHIFEEKIEGIESSFKRSTLLVLAITMHNIPEGLAVGVSFGAYGLTGSPEYLGAAIALALGIGLQNFPEGSAVAFPLYSEGVSAKKSFFYGQLSAVVEPFSILIGIALVSVMTTILPFALAFAAGAMMFVVVEELIPESQAGGNTNTVTFYTIVGLAVMMGLDVLL